jgi:hypothetical protein
MSDDQHGDQHQQNLGPIPIESRPITTPRTSRGRSFSPS